MAFQQERGRETDNANHINIWSRIDRRTLANGDTLIYNSSTERWHNATMAAALASVLPEVTGFLAYSIEVVTEIAMGDTEVLTYDSTDFNDDNQLNTATGIWTCPRSGYYKIQAHTVAYWEGNADFPIHAYLQFELEDDPDVYNPYFSTQKTIHHQEYDSMELNILRFYIEEGQKARFSGRARFTGNPITEDGTLTMNFFELFETGGGVSFYSIVSTR